MKKTQVLVIFIVAVMVIFGVIWLSSQRQPSITVGLVTWAKSGTVVGSSELHAGTLFLEEHPDSPIEMVILDDEWDPDKTVAVIEEAMQDGVQFFIASHPSKCTVASMPLFEEPGALMINTASTSPSLTGRDDYILRIVADAEQEQRAIAQYIHSLPGDRILVLQDTSNLPYTDPAFATFSAELEELSGWHIVHHKLIVSDFDPDVLETLMAEDFDMLYILAGSFQSAIGNIAQLFYHSHPDAPIMLTPWARSSSILEITGPAITQIILPSQYPCRSADVAVGDYFRRYQDRYGYEPHAMTMGVAQALELLDQAFTEGYHTPEEVKNYLLSIPIHQTSLGAVSFDSYGDVTTDFYFITDLEQVIQ